MQLLVEPGHLSDLGSQASQACFLFDWEDIRLLNLSKTQETRPEESRQ